MSVARRRFRIIKEIAEGGFGKVYLSEQISQDGFSRIVAVKLLHAKWSTHDEVVKRTRDEARLLGLIRHQHIVKVEDLTMIDGKCAIVMEYLEGCDLKWMMTFLKEKGLEFPRAALFEVILATASALDAAYNGRPLQGGEPLRVIHRDIKPSNIFATVAGGVKVLDFGTARANFAEREARTQALAFGSQGYMAPERMLGEEDTPAADIFSLGITAFELLTGESFGRIPPRPNKFAQKIDEKVAAVPLDGDPEYCEQVRELMRLMLSYDPTERPTAAQVVEICEVLVQEAKDMALRRFCRTLVAEAKANEPELNTGDPLAGSTVEEDVSETMNVGAGGVPQTTKAMDSLTPTPSLTPAGTTGAFGSLPSQAPAPPPAAPPPLAPPPRQDTPRTPVQADNKGGGAASQEPAHQQLKAGSSLPPQTALPSLPPEPIDQPSGGGSNMMLLAAAAVVLILVVGLGVVVVGGGGLAALMVTQSSGPVPAPEPVVVEAPKPEPVAPTLKGGQILSPDTRTDVKKAKTTLSFSDAAGGKVTITGGGGFRAEWDGKAPFDLGEVGDGMYKTIIELPNGNKIRGKSFTVSVGKKKTCAFTFDVQKESWEGAGCT